MASEAVQNPELDIKEIVQRKGVQGNDVSYIENLVEEYIDKNHSRIEANVEFLEKRLAAGLLSESDRKLPLRMQLAIALAKEQKIDESIEESGGTPTETQITRAPRASDPDLADKMQRVLDKAKQKRTQEELKQNPQSSDFGWKIIASLVLLAYFILVNYIRD